MAPEGEGHAPAPAAAPPTAELLREAVDEARDLVRLEAQLARSELRAELLRARTAGIAFGVAGACALMGVTMLLVTLVLAIAPTWVGALVVAGVTLALAAVAAALGRAAIPKKPLDETRRRLEADVRRIRERVA